MKGKHVTGLHHVTALADHAGRNLDFYAGILGLRLVKKTINFDAPEVYHLYYGNETGSPGTIMTFFPYPGIARGRHGKGQLTVTSFSVPGTSLDYWIQRLEHFDVAHTSPQERFADEVFVYFKDVHGLGLELVFNTRDERPGHNYGPVPMQHAIRGFYSVSLAEEGYERTAGLLTEGMDYSLIAEKGNRFRYSASGKPGDLVDILCMPDELRGLGGSGTVHHVAFATPDAETQLEVREKLLSLGRNVTPVLDRQYFRSIYFREPGGVLFEVATAPPGFAIDEDVADLGSELKLPPWLEPSRKTIARDLDELTFDLEKYRDK